MKDTPADARRHIERVSGAICGILGGDLVGLYVHGSLALGCFNPAWSDIDILAVTGRNLTEEEKLALVDVFLRLSLDPYAVEADLLSVEQLRNWRHPSPFELHYSEWRRARWEADPRATLASFPDGSADLAAHVAVARAEGIAVIGPPPQEIFPRVPDADFRDSLLRDLAWCRDVESGDLYGILSPCRIWAALATGEVHSKASGAQWALSRLPVDLRPMVDRALATYSGADEPTDVDETERGRLIDFIEEHVRR